MRCKKESLIKGMIAAVAAGILTAFAVGCAVIKLCGCKNSMLKKRAKRALKSAKSYIDELI